MNQHHVVGIGNIYANEILFDAKIRPTRKSKTITKKEHYKIAASTKKILKTAIKAGGTTLKDFYQPDGNKGYFKIDLAVYDRANETCKNCKKELIQRIIQAQRATFFCRKCQTLPVIFFNRAALTLGGTKRDTSPPNVAISLTKLDET